MHRDVKYPRTDSDLRIESPVPLRREKHDGNTRTESTGISKDSIGDSSMGYIHIALSAMRRRGDVAERRKLKEKEKQTKRRKEDEDEDEKGVKNTPCK